MVAESRWMETGVHFSLAVTLMLAGCGEASEGEAAPSPDRAAVHEAAALVSGCLRRTCGSEDYDPNRDCSPSPDVCRTTCDRLQPEVDRLMSGTEDDQNVAWELRYPCEVTLNLFTAADGLGSARLALERGELQPEAWCATRRTALDRIPDDLSADTQRELRSAIAEVCGG